MFDLINIVLALILLISVIYILVRKVLIGLKGSDSGIINLVLIALGLIGLGCALSVALGISRVGGLLEALNADKNISVDKIHFVKGNTTNNGGKKLSEINTTWGEFLDTYNKENPQDQGNPRQDITKDHKVRVVKIEYPNGLESKAGFYNYALVTQVYDSKTGELLTVMGAYRDEK